MQVRSARKGGRDRVREMSEMSESRGKRERERWRDMG